MNILWQRLSYAAFVFSFLATAGIMKMLADGAKAWRNLHELRRLLIGFGAGKTTG